MMANPMTHTDSPDPYPLHTQLKAILKGSEAIRMLISALAEGEVTDRHGRPYALVVVDDSNNWERCWSHRPAELNYAQYALLGIDYDEYMAEFDRMIEETRKAAFEEEKH